jgi:FKBP-type peptidyl-prolyl cis-trans isomerase
MAETGPSRLLVVLLVVVVVVAGIGVALTVNYLITPRPASPILSVQEGDNVTVNYIGIMGSGPQQGKVFDTSLYSVYINNATWPKALTYHGRNSTSWLPLDVHVGPSGSYTVGNGTFGTVVTGFWEGIIGAQGNQSRVVTVPYNLGYGPQDPACFRSAPLSFSAPVLITVAPSQFMADYPNATAAIGATFTDPTYGWTDYVLSVNQSAVTIENLASVGETSAPYGWNITVTNVSSTTITLENDITAANYGNILGHVPTAETCSANQFIITSVDPAAGNFTEYWGSQYLQQQGQTMIFIVTPIDILPPGKG